MAFSYSQLQTYRRCPKQYEFACVKKVSRQISLSESFGSGVHNALKRWGELEMMHQGTLSPAGQTRRLPGGGVSQIPLFTEEKPKPDIPLTVLTLKQFWRECFQAEGYFSRMERDSAVMQGDKAMEHFFAWWSQKSRMVMNVEQAFKLTVPFSRSSDFEVAAAEKNVVLSGRIDRIERLPEGLHVIDFKTSSVRSQTDVDSDLQLSIYAAALTESSTEPVAKLSLLFLDETQCLEISTERNPSQIKDAMTSIKHIAERIESGDFRATPTVEKCKYCPYREICPSRAI